jgi:hypothetical protein
MSRAETQGRRVGNGFDLAFLCAAASPRELVVVGPDFGPSRASGSSDKLRRAEAALRGFTTSCVCHDGRAHDHRVRPCHGHLVRPCRDHLVRPCHGHLGKLPAYP